MSLDIAPTFEAALYAQRSNLLRELSNASQAAAESQQRKTVGQLTDTAQNLLTLNTGAGFSLDPTRGRFLVIFLRLSQVSRTYTPLAFPVITWSLIGSVTALPPVE